MFQDESQQPLTLAALFAQPGNASLLRFLGLQTPEDVRVFEVGASGSPYDEGGRFFFHNYGRFVPSASRLCLCIHNILAHERTAQAFALHHGRFTFALRADFVKLDRDLIFTSGLRSETLDGDVDLTPLGPRWTIVAADDSEDLAQAFLDAYHLAGTENRVAD